MQRQREEKGHDDMVMNYDETAAALRAEIERLEDELGIDEAFAATYLLLQAQAAVLRARDALDRMEAKKGAV